MLSNALSKISIKVLVACLILFCSIYYFGSFVFAQEETSPNFIIRGDSLSAGSSGGSSSNFDLTGDINPFSDLADSSSFRQELGYNPRIQAFTPYAPLLENSTSTYYDRLKLTVNPSGNPSDTLFAIAISDDDFATYLYVQNDNSVGSVLGSEDYQTYDDWGNSSGFEVLQLESNRTYKARVKALSGDFTETGWGPESAEASTEVPYITLDISNAEVYFGTLSANSVSQTSGIDVTIDTNATSGYQTYINGTGNAVSGGLYNGSNLITSATTVLSAGTEGYGAQASSGTATIAGKYGVSGNNVGSVDLSVSPLSSSASEVLSEVTNVLFKVAISGTTAAGEYADTVYFTVSPSI